MRYGVFSALGAVALLALTFALPARLTDADTQSGAAPAYEIEVLPGVADSDPMNEKRWGIDAAGNATMTSGWHLNNNSIDLRGTSSSAYDDIVVAQFRVVTNPTVYDVSAGVGVPRIYVRVSAIHDTDDDSHELCRKVRVELYDHPRPDGKPEIGAAVVTTVLEVETTSPRYSSYDTTGAVATAGSYAFLMPDDDDEDDDATTAVTTYEALRDGTTTALLIHKSDAHGASQAALYDAVATGDLFEWHEAEDCFVRYKVTEVKPDPAGTVPRKLLAVEWMTYAYTGCSGGIPGETAVTVRHDPPPVTSYSVTSPIRHGPFLLIPKGWTGATEEPTRVTYPQSAARATWNRPAGWTGSLAEIQQHPLWSAPELPSGWAFDRANDFDGYLATEYVPAARNALIEIHVWRVEGLPIHEPYVDPRAGRIHEARLIDDYPAFLIYDPSNGSGLPVTVIIFKSDSGIIYEVTAHWALNTDYQSVIEIARSLYE